MNAPHVAAPDEQDFDAIATTQLRARRKAWLIVAGVFAALFVLFAVAFVSDEAPPDTSDLAVPRLNPPEEQNAYAQLAKIALALPLERPEESDSEKPLPLMLAGKIAWDVSIVAPVLAGYAPDLREQTERALELPHSETPDYIQYGGAPAAEVTAIRRLAKVLLLRARIAQQDGRDTDAAVERLTALRIGDRLMEAHGLMMHFLTALAIRRSALPSIHEHADSADVPAVVLREYLAALNTMGRDSPNSQFAAVSAAARWEHVIFAGTISSIDRDEIVRTYGETVAKRIVMRLPGGLQRNKTIRWHAEVTREFLADISTPPESGRLGKAVIAAKRIYDVKWPLRAENFSGRLYSMYSLPAIPAYLAAPYHDQAQLHLTRIYLALRLYHLDHGGALPAKLDDLVPDYLAAVPLDPFDGKPLRYDRALTTIWSTDYERKTITTADDELPRNMAAHRLRFARSPAPALPTYAEYLATQNAGPGLLSESNSAAAPAIPEPAK